MKPSVNECQQAFSDDGRSRMLENHGIQKAVFIICLRKQFHGAAVPPAVAEDDGAPLQHPLPSSVVRVRSGCRSRESPGSCDYVSEGLPLLLHLPCRQLHGASVRSDARHLKKRLPVEGKQIDLPGPARFQHVQGVVEILSESHFTGKTLAVPAGRGPGPYPYCRGRGPPASACRRRPPRLRRRPGTRLSSQAVQHILSCFPAP